MDDSASSKVTVEYHDPSGVFPLISRDLAARLPLRNLNWKSPIRPLRSIGALHVEFVPDAVSEANPSSPVDRRLQRVDSYGPRPTSTPPAGGDTAARERRHQIPGLQQTPYLKLYILRCDDKDTYKAASRQLLRDWVRKNAPETQSNPAVNKLDHHDAFEWLILHVVIPDTVAASEPRWTAASRKDPDELVERPQSITKWPGKSTRTVLDKIRADFNPTSKSAPERVAQLRLQKNAVPPQLLPKTPVASPYSESPQEQENAWQDLISKFKTLILMSFDLRVSQYEDDIREKDLQRTLPGWNFCTFFVLKEGLAKGFESVGLVEDALAIYDELSVGLDAAMRDYTPGNTLADNVSMVRKEIDRLFQGRLDDGTIEQMAQTLREFLDKPLDLRQQEYREAIVSSQISLFDFQCYIFARQKALLLRLGNVDKLRSGLNDVTKQTLQVQPTRQSAGSHVDDELAYIAGACNRASVFATANARILKNELTAGFINEFSSQFPDFSDTVSSSWRSSIAQQMLDETASPRLPTVPGPVDLASYHRQTGVGAAARRETGGFNFGQGANQHPARTSSLRDPLESVPQSSQPKTTGESRSGLAELAASRAELYMVQRRIIETMAKKKGWLAGWAAVTDARTMQDVDLRRDEEAGEEAKPNDTDKRKSDTMSKYVLNERTQSALSSFENFQTAHEQLSDLAVRHYIAAGRTAFAETAMSDIAMLKFQMGDYANAASYFQRALPQHAQGKRSFIQAEMLRVYAQCLKELHRRDEFVRVTLSLVSKVVSSRRSRRLPAVRFPSPSGWFDEEDLDVRGYLPDLVAFSDELPYNFTTALTDFFADVEVGREVVHNSDKDGFSIQLHFRHLLEEDLSLDRIRLRLTLAQDSAQEVWMESEGPIDLKFGLIRCSLRSNVTTFGTYLIDRLLLEAEKLHFVHEFQPKPQTTPLGITNATAAERKTTASGPSILLYPNHEALDVQMSLAPDIHIDRPRAILVRLDTGWNDTDQVSLRLRAASAGLRLHTADASLQDEHGLNIDTSTAGTIKFDKLASGTKFQLYVPYSLEHNLHQVTLRLSAHYETVHGSFEFLSTTSIPVELPLDVDVHDVFKAANLFSKFTIRTTSALPLLVTDVRLEQSPAFEVKPIVRPEPMLVFEKQPAGLTYQITRKALPEGQALPKKEAALSLVVAYHCIDAVVLERLRTKFTQDLANSPHAGLERLLTPLLLEMTRPWIVKGDNSVEQAVLMEEIHIPGYGQLGWSSVIGNLNVDKRDGIIEWLQGWHKESITLPLTLTSNSIPDPTTARRITISVDVPTIDVVHTVSLALGHTDNTIHDQAATRLPSIATVGQPVPATLRIKHTRRWASASSKPSSSPLSFVYEIQDLENTWLIGGQRRAAFSAIEDKILEFGVVLVPLKAGVNLLPSVDIQAQKKEGSEDVSCETDYLESGESLLVKEDVRTTTITVAEETAGAASWAQRASVESGGTTMSRVVG